MTDTDRGAYAPQYDAPLTFDTFDARGRGGGRRPMPMTLIGSAVILLVLVVALVMFYRSGVKGAGGPPRPVGEASPAIKTAPGAEEQPPAVGAGMEVYTPQNVPAHPAPAFTPTPEQPMARPAPQPTPAVAPAAPGLKVETAPLHPPVTAPVAAAKPQPAPKPVVAAPVVTAQAPPAAKTAPVAPKPSPVIAKAAPASKAEAAPVPAKPTAVAAVTRTDSTTITTVLHTGAPAPVAVLAKPAAAKPAASPAVKLAKVDAEAADPGAPVLRTAPAKPVPAKIATAAGGPAVVQIGAFSSAALADKGYSDASAKLPGQLGGKSKKVDVLQRDGHTFYRTTVHGFGSRTDAAAFCAALKAKGGACMVRS